MDVRGVGLMKEANAFAVMRTPFLFRDQQHYRNYVASDLFQNQIRVQPSPMFRKTFSAWGAVPTSIKVAKLFSAIKTGMIDGQDNGVVTVATTGLNNVIKHVTPINWAQLRLGYG